MITPWCIAEFWSLNNKTEEVWVALPMILLSILYLSLHSLNDIVFIVTRFSGVMIRISGIYFIRCHYGCMVYSYMENIKGA